MLSLLGLLKLKKKSQINIAQNFFQGISRRNLVGPYKKFQTLVKNFKNCKSRVSEVKRIFLLRFFVFVNWIDTLNANPPSSVLAGAGAEVG